MVGRGWRTEVKNQNKKDKPAPASVTAMPSGPRIHRIKGHTEEQQRQSEDLFENMITSVTFTMPDNYG